MVEEGCYSDYGVVAIFSTKAEADKFVEHRPGASAREWELDTWREEQAKFCITFDMGGSITGIIEEASTDEPSGNVRENRFQQDQITLIVHRGPRDLAVKIASERYYKIRAFLDQSDAMMERANYPKNGNYRFNDALQVASILAGLDQAPDPPRCNHDRNIRVILGLPDIPER